MVYVKDKRETGNTESEMDYQYKRMNVHITSSVQQGFPGGSEGKESACNAGDPGLIPWVGKIPWRREWLPTPVLSLV